MYAREYRVAADSSKIRSLSENDEDNDDKDDNDDGKACNNTSSLLVPLATLLVPKPKASISQEATTLVCSGRGPGPGVKRWRVVSTRKSNRRNQSSAPDNTYDT